MKKIVIIILISLLLISCGGGTGDSLDMEKQSCDALFYNFYTGNVCRFIDPDYDVVCYASPQGIGCVKL